MYGASRDSYRRNRFTEFAVKDLFSSRFYVGVVSFKGAEYAGQHEAILTEAEWDAAKRRRVARTLRTPRRRHGALAGRLRCSRCERPVWTGRSRHGTPLYRERHDKPCSTEGRSVTSAAIDAQVGRIFGAVRIREEAVQVALGEARRLVTTEDEVSTLKALRRRLARAYADGGLSEAEYESRIAEVDARLRAATPLEEAPLLLAARLVRDLPLLWERAGEAHRRELVGALVQEVYVDIAERRVSGLVAVPEFDGLLRQATFEAEGVVLVEMRGLEPSTIATPRDAGTTLHVPQRERYWRASWRGA